MTTQALAAAQRDLQGHYAGGVSRLAAYAADAVLSSGLFTAGLAGLSFLVGIVTGFSIDTSRHSVVVSILFAAWEFVYFGYSWAAAGRSPGMAALGIRIVAADGAGLDRRRAIVRVIAFPLSFLLCGLGLAGILVQSEHRALHDLIAGTAVVYAWDARAAWLRARR
jgi:uncharacterized RDD family membrane protein YckC